MLGYLDDLMIVPLGILVVVKLIPPNVMAESRMAASLTAEKPVSCTAPVVIALIWTGSIMLTGWLSLFGLASAPSFKTRIARPRLQCSADV